MKNVLVISTQPALNSLNGKDALDLALIFGAFEQNVTMVFMGLGVTQTLSKQTPELISQKDYLATIKALELYDIEQVYSVKEDLVSLGLDAKPLLPSISKINLHSLAQLKQQADHILII